MIGASEDCKFPKLKSRRLRSVYSTAEFICIPHTLWAKQEDVQYVNNRSTETYFTYRSTRSLRTFRTSKKKVISHTDMQ